MPNHYLLIGLKPEDRDVRLATLRANFFLTPAALKFDCETFDGNKLSAKTLEIALYSYPAIAGKKLVVVRRAEKLDEAALTMIVRFLDDNNAHVVLVLDATSWDGRSGLKKNIRERLQPAIAAAPEKVHTVFDMMDTAFGGTIADGLKLLNMLLERGEAEEMLLGGMIWHWSNRVKGRTSADKYKKGLLVLQEADENLKRSRFPKREHALEVALVKLTSLLRA